MQSFEINKSHSNTDLDEFKGLDSYLPTPVPTLKNSESCSQYEEDPLLFCNSCNSLRLIH